MFLIANTFAICFNKDYLLTYLDLSTLQVLITFYVVFISTFYWRLASKAL